MCVISGLPAKYRDPVSGQPYANIEAFRALRKLHPPPSEAGRPPQAAGREQGQGAAAAAAGEGGTPANHRPIVLSTGGVTRRINKVAMVA